MENMLQLFLLLYPILIMPHNMYAYIQWQDARYAKHICPAFSKVAKVPQKHRRYYISEAAHAVAQECMMHPPRS